MFSRGLLPVALLLATGCADSLVAFPIPIDGGGGGAGGALSDGGGGAGGGGAGGGAGGADAGCDSPRQTCGGACVDVLQDNTHCGACGSSCAPNEACNVGQCRLRDCVGTDCAPDQVCAAGRCRHVRCDDTTCASGTTCHQGTCVPNNCIDTNCPTGTACVGGACVDVPCIGVTCSLGTVCRGGRCEVVTGCDGGTDAGAVSDVNNCGQCGNVCPTPVNATRACVAGRCGRARCVAGFFDVDGRATFGCESQCSGATCTLPDGGQVTLTQPPVHEASVTVRELSSGGAHGAATQTSAQYHNVGVLGESSPVSAPQNEQTGGAFRNFGGVLQQDRTR